MRHMSFALTVEPMKRHEKGCTRRYGWDDIKVGELLQAVEQCQGLKQGEHVKKKDVTVYNGDVLALLPQLPDESVDCCITSPPYWGLRDYKADGQLGLEKTPEEYVAKMVQVFREVRRVLKKEGICWLNLGDSYAGGGNGAANYPGDYLKQNSNTGSLSLTGRQGIIPDGLKPKDLVGIPWRCAFALQSDGWWLRQDIIWSKPNPMPESVTDRCTKSHEYIFLMAKSTRYYYDAEAIKEEANYDGRNDTVMKGSDKYADDFVPNQSPQTFHQRGHERWKWQDGIAYRNKRSVWEITTKPYKEAHFATFPRDLVQPMVLAGTSAKGVCPNCGKAWERVVEKEGITKRQTMYERGQSEYAKVNGKGRMLNCASVFQLDNQYKIARWGTALAFL